MRNSNTGIPGTAVYHGSGAIHGINSWTQISLCDYFWPVFVENIMHYTKWLHLDMVQVYTCTCPCPSTCTNLFCLVIAAQGLNATKGIPTKYCVVSMYYIYIYIYFFFCEMSLNVRPY